MFWARRSRPEGPSTARVTWKPSMVRRVSRESRMAASSSMMRMWAEPAMRGSGGWAESSVAGEATVATSGMDGVPSDGFSVWLGYGFAWGALRGGYGELKTERGADADLALGVHLAAVLLHDAVGDRESEAGALVLAGARAGSWW